MIQTYTPQNDVILAAADQDYDRFYDGEIRLRQLRRDPPFADQFFITVTGPEEGTVRRAAAGLRDGLRAAAGRDPYRDMALDILGPAPAPVVKVNNRYRYRVTVIGRNDKILRGLLAAFMKEFARRPEHQEMCIRDSLEELARLEAEQCPSIDRAADAFAALLAGASEEEADPVRRRVLRQLLYHLGRWVYLVDAADDLKKDVKSGSYNPLVYRFHAEGGTLTADDKAALAATLDSSVRAMAAAFELADFGPWRAIIESVLYEGLYAVGAAVLNGTFRKGLKRKQRKAGA